MALGPSPKGLKDLLEIKSTDTEQNAVKGYSELLEEKKANDKIIHSENERAFEQAAKKYFSEKEARPGDDKDKRPPSPPARVPNADLTTAAAAGLPVLEEKQPQALVPPIPRGTKNKGHSRPIKKGRGKKAPTKIKAKATKSRKQKGRQKIKRRPLSNFTISQS